MKEEEERKKIVGLKNLLEKYRQTKRIGIWKRSRWNGQKPGKKKV